MLRTWRAMCPKLQSLWHEDIPEDWDGVKFANGRVVKIKLTEERLTGAVPAVIGRLSALRTLDLGYNKLTSLPAEIGQLTSLTVLYLSCNKLTSLPAEIGQLTSLKGLSLVENQLTSLPAEIGQLTSLKLLHLDKNQLTSLPAEIGQLTSLEHLGLWHNQLTTLPARIRELRADWRPRTSLAPRLPHDRGAGCEVYMDDGVTFDE